MKVQVGNEKSMNGVRKYLEMYLDCSVLEEVECLCVIWSSGPARPTQPALVSRSYRGVAMSGACMAVPGHHFTHSCSSPLTSGSMLSPWWRRNKWNKHLFMDNVYLVYSKCYVCATFSLSTFSEVCIGFLVSLLFSRSFQCQNTSNSRVFQDSNSAFSTLYLHM